MVPHILLRGRSKGERTQCFGGEGDSKGGGSDNGDGNGGESE